MQYIVRQFTPEDLDAVVKINRACLPENYPPEFFLDHYYNNPQLFWVAEVAGKIVGYIMCRLEYGLSSFERAFTRRVHVISIAVLPPFRRQGIATALMEKVLYRSTETGASEIYLEVRVSNTPAISLYRKLGFTAVKVIKSYYLDGEDAYLMARKLPYP